MGIGDEIRKKQEEDKNRHLRHVVDLIFYTENEENFVHAMNKELYKLCKDPGDSKLEVVVKSYQMELLEGFFTSKYILKPRSRYKSERYERAKNWFDLYCERHGLQYELHTEETLKPSKDKYYEEIATIIITPEKKKLLLGDEAYTLGEKGEIQIEKLKNKYKDGIPEYEIVGKLAEKAAGYYKEWKPLSFYILIEKKGVRFFDDLEYDGPLESFSFVDLQRADITKTEDLYDMGFLVAKKTIEILEKDGNSKYEYGIYYLYDSEVNVDEVGFVRYFIRRCGEMEIINTNTRNWRE